MPCRGRKRNFDKIGDECLHPYLEKQNGRFVCLDCMYIVDDQTRIDEELSQERRIKEHDRSVVLSTGKTPAELSHERGVTIKWLVQWTIDNDAWEWSTRKVRRHLILPPTAALRCRYVELPEMAEVIGPAVTFISHTWEAPFGDLVAAVAEGADPERRVWIDIFAVRQWPGSESDLDFGGAVGYCSSFLLVCTALPEISDLQATNKPRHIESISLATRNKIAFFRIWCLLEIYTAAMTPDMTIVMKGGSHRRLSDGRVIFDSELDMLNILTQFVDVDHAQAWFQSDRETILKKIRESSLGIEGLNAKARSMIAGSFSCSGNALVQCAACGDTGPLQEICRRVTEPFIVNAAGGGYLQLVGRLIEAGVDVNMRGSRDTTALIEAAWGGHPTVIDMLLEHGACINLTNSQGRIAIHWAALQGHCECVQLLLEAEDKENGYKSASTLNAKDGVGFTPLIFAARNGHAACVELLISKGASVLETTVYGRAALGFAAKYGHFECVKLLLKGGSDLNSCDIQGTSEGCTALMFAKQRGHRDCANAIEYFEKFSHLPTS